MRQGDRRCSDLSKDSEDSIRPDGELDSPSNAVHGQLNLKRRILREVGDYQEAPSNSCAWVHPQSFGIDAHMKQFCGGSFWGDSFDRHVLDGEALEVPC